MGSTKRGRQNLAQLAPGFSDLRDLYQTVLLFLGLSRHRPSFGRYGFAEKFEFWALVWGTCVMTLTGLLLAYVGWTLGHAPQVDRRCRGTDPQVGSDSGRRRDRDLAYLPCGVEAGRVSGQPRLDHRRDQLRAAGHGTPAGVCPRHGLAPRVRMHQARRKPDAEPPAKEEVTLSDVSRSMTPADRPPPEITFGD